MEVERVEETPLDSEFKAPAGYIPKELKGCDVCTDLWRCFTDPKFRDTVTVDRWDYALEPKCPNHAALVHKIREISKRGIGDIVQRKTEEVNARYCGEVVCVLQNIVKKCFFRLHLVRQPDLKIGNGLITDPNWMDLSLVRTWKERCISSHEGWCENPLNAHLAMPAYLVDVEDNCVVQGRIGMSYVALSYVWGEAATKAGLAVTSDMMKTLQKPNSFQSDHFRRTAPPIFQRAMKLTACAGERYLWIDALCILHDDRDETAHQISLMGSIYSNAVFAIIAADGDAQSGLSGLPGISGPRVQASYQDVIPFGTSQLLVVPEHPRFGKLTTVPYNSRGWTFQEYMMSTRKLIVEAGVVSWECACSTEREDAYLGLRRRVDADDVEHLMKGLHFLEYMSGFISSYNVRQLTYPEDALPGIMGLLTLLSRVWGGFLYGLPEKFFDRSLGWAAQKKQRILHRRTCSERKGEHTGHFQGMALPSWSWVGWHGAVDLFGHAVPGALDAPFDENTIPITTWYTSNSLTGTRRRIRSTWYEHRDPSNTNEQLPSVQPLCVPDTDTLQGYKYNDNPYCFSAVHSHADVMPIQTQYLFCETTRARVHVTRRNKNAPNTSSSSHNLLAWGDDDDNAPYVVLCKDARAPIGDSAAIGRLYPHNQAQARELTARGAEIEVVAISKCQVQATIDISSLISLHRNGGSPPLQGVKYTVLWVEWKDGVAYRMASGWIDEYSWDNLDKEDISLVLG